ncbi:dolichyl-phosphate-mannose--protein mannosyltransferase [Brachybacterium endophyticum]|uniref:Polyprenol-phosphate-mannose--protein mannosyltransferase n=2 Tax=Brachybacterium endophyticum TaxID=2182385 RepID=A0A2U2RMR9_9MICO|nr:dolichyl-phosphate-mannose--protein mannosyltransferase [Brachybacterium endophyticum]
MDLPRGLGSVRAWAGVILVTVLALVLRVYHLGSIHDLIFDETYYVKDGWTLIHNGVEMNWPDKPDPAFTSGDVNSYEDSGEYVVHPPIGKWVIGLGMLILGGDSSWGWRLSVAVLGSLSVLMCTLITRRLFRSTGIGLIAGLLLAVDGLHLVMSRTSLLDLVLMFFALAAFGALLIDRDRFREKLARHAAAAVVRGETLPLLGYRAGFRPWRLSAGILLGLACSVKWSGIYFLAIFGIMTVLWDWWARRRVGERRWMVNGLFRDAVPAFVAMVGGALLTYLVSWTGWFASDKGYMRNWAEENGHPDGNPVVNALRSLLHYHSEAYDFHIHLDSPHPYQANPLGWLLQIRPTNFYYRSYDYGQMGCQVEKCASQVFSVGNPLIWWLGALSIVVVIVVGVWKRDGRAWAALAGIVAGYLPWLMYLDRTIFTFYSVVYEPWLIMCLAYALGLLVGPPGADRERKLAGTLLCGSLLTLIVLISAFFWPIWTGQVIDVRQWEWRMWLPSWT